MKLTFLGAAGTVTGSKYLLESGRYKILIDAGLFQGAREWNVRNWDEPGFDPKAINAILLTHAHLDHIGMLPRFVKLGVSCPIFGTAATLRISELILRDSAKLQEEEAEYRNERGRSRHHPALPLYTIDDAEATIRLFKPVDFMRSQEVLPGVKVEWRTMGHILGAASISVEIEGKRLVFSGDIGRYKVPILSDPQPVALGDLLLIESTYGDRLHPTEESVQSLARIINQTFAAGGMILIPSFAVGRTQLLLFYLRELKQNKQIPDLPIVIDSPMARDATSIYAEFPQCYDEEALGILHRGQQPFSTTRLRFTRDRKDSIALNDLTDPMIIISASGMLTGGRILHHLAQRVGDARNTLLLVGFQPPGGRGAWLKSGAREMRLFGQEISVRCKVEEISGFSAHADREELLRWCKECPGKPKRVAIVHGEPEAAASFRESLVKQFGWDVFVASYRQAIEI